MHCGSRCLSLSCHLHPWSSSCAFLLDLILPFYFLLYLPPLFLFLKYLKSVVNLYNSAHESMDSTEEFSLSPQFVGNFFVLTVRHITFKRLKVGRRVRCSVLCTVFVGEKRGEEKRKKKGREKKRRRGERGPTVLMSSTPPCVHSKCLRVYWQNAGVLPVHAPSRATYHTTTQQHNNTTCTHNATCTYTHATTPSVHTRSQHNRQPTVILRRKSECLDMCTAVNRP